MTVDEARLRAHEKAMATDPVYREAMWRHREWWRLPDSVEPVARSKPRLPAVAGNLFEPGRRKPDGSYVHVYRQQQVRAPLPMPRVFLFGPRWRRFLMTYQTHTGRVAHHPRVYDFEPDVREFVVRTEIRPGVIAEWSD